MSAQIGGQASLVAQINSEASFKTYRLIRQIVSEEHHALIKKYKLRPGNLSDEVIAKILNRMDELIVG